MHCRVLDAYGLIFGLVNKLNASMEFTLDNLQKSDWTQVRSIYASGLATGLSAFKSAPPKWHDWDAGQLDLGRIVARDSESKVLGWAALAPAPDT